jgi:hypothetical protein
LTGLPATRTFATPHGPLLLCHGIGENDTVGVYPGGNDAEVAQALRVDGFGPLLDTFAFVACGHTHCRLVRPLAGGPVLLNPGPLQWGYPDRGFLVVDFEAGAAQCYNLSDAWRHQVVTTIQTAEVVALPAPPTTTHTNE